MISLYYAKKIGNKYVLNFYADKQEDLAAFDAAKEFMFYGVPAAGSTITVTTGNDGVNYYLNEQGSFVKIEVGGDEPTGGLTPFTSGLFYGGVDFGDVQNGDTSTDIDNLLAEYDTRGKYEYEGGVGILVNFNNGQDMLCCVDLTQQGLQGYAICYNETPLYTTEDNIVNETQIPKGFHELTNGVFDFQNDLYVSSIEDTTPPEFNGVLLGGYNEINKGFSITVNVTNGTYSGDNTIYPDREAHVIITPQAGYEQPPKIDGYITFSGASIALEGNVGYSEITISNPYENVVLDVTCPVK